MTTSAKWVLGVLLALSAALAALGAGMAARSASPPRHRSSGSYDAALYLSALRGELPMFAGLQPAFSSRLVQAASSQMGRHYVWGGTGRAGFDCSGFTSWAYAKAGRVLPRTSGEQYREGSPVAASGLRTGDLVFFGENGKVAHVGIYLSEGKFIHSSRASGGVDVDSLTGSYWNRTYAGARRVADRGGRYP